MLNGAAHPSTGFGIVLVSGILTASFAAPMKLSRRWSWENTWFVYATFALLLIPLALVTWAIPHPSAFYASIPLRTILPAFLFGFGWGIAQVTFGLSIVRVGMAMAFAIVIGLSSLLGSLIPLAVFHPDDLLGHAGLALTISAIFLALGLILYAQAGREREVTSAESSPSGTSFRTGILLCVFTGCFGSMINMGFVFGSGIATQAMKLGVTPEKATLSVWLAVLSAGFIPNFAYTLFLMKKNHSGVLFCNDWPRESMLALAAAVLWVFGMLGYGMGASVMGKYGNSLGFAACMAALLLWSSVLGLITGEWKSAPLATKRRMYSGLALIIISVTILGISGVLHK
jgi:L-rhamnose-H+ transport protein